jgi:hypothetical protein
MEETGVEYPEKTTDLSQVRQTLSHNVVSSTLTMNRVQTHNFNGDRQITQVVVNPTTIRSQLPPCIIKVKFMCYIHKYYESDKHRITAALNVKTDIITSHAVSLIGRAVKLVIMYMYVETFKTNVIVFICNIKMCLMSH